MAKEHERVQPEAGSHQLPLSAISYLITEYRSTFMRQLKDMLNLRTSTTFQHTNLQGTRIAKDEDEDVKS